MPKAIPATCETTSSPANAADAIAMGEGLMWEYLMKEIIREN